MVPASEQLKVISHPLIASMYMKKDFGMHHRSEDVLVIQTCLPRPEDDYSNFDSSLMDLLSDLEGLKNQAEHCVGSFDRVDILTR